MNDHALLSQSVERILRDTLEGQQPVPPIDHWDESAWRDLVAAGLTSVGIDEHLGGSGGDIDDVITIVRTAAHTGASAPLADHGAISSWLLARAGLTVPQVVTCWSIQVEDATDAHLADVAWGAIADQLVVVRQRGLGVEIELATLDPSKQRSRVDVSGEHGADLRQSERKTLVVAPCDASLTEVQLRVARVRCAQMTGALDALLPLCTSYARDREQFGRAIASFQAVQHLLARLAGEVLAAQAALDIACSGSGDSAPLAIAAAKVRIGEAATKASRVSQQIHGAIGFTEEHQLARFTRRLWRWREDGGNETLWARWLGQQLAHGGAGHVWPLLTSVPAPEPPRMIEASP